MRSAQGFFVYEEPGDPETTLFPLHSSITMPDYLIVGGSLAGCVIASRLKEYDPSASVTLLEAGPNEHDNPLMMDPMGTFQLHESKYEYNYKTVLQKHYDNRQSLRCWRKAALGHQ